jgi:hypothetical protein
MVVLVLVHVLLVGPVEAEVETERVHVARERQQ